MIKVFCSKGEKILSISFFSLSLIHLFLGNEERIVVNSRDGI